MLKDNTVLLLIGFQNDYFAKDGILHGVFEDSDSAENVINNTCNLLQALKKTNVLVVETPIKFTKDYQELDNPVGILKIIKDNGAFKENSYGSATIEPIKQAATNIMSIPGKRGLNCFSNTDLKKILQENNIKNVMIAGAVTSLCIDTAGREAMDLGYSVKIISDCILSRTLFEQKYYLEEIMPLYSSVITSEEVMAEIGN